MKELEEKKKKMEKEEIENNKDGKKIHKILGN